MRSAIVTAFLFLIVLMGAVPAPSLAAAAPAGAAADAPAGLTSAETQQLLSVLQNPQKRQQLITTLQSLQKVLPTVAAAAPAAAGGANAAAPAATNAADKAKPAVALQPNSLGADLISQANGVLNQIDVNLGETLTTITDYHEFGAWAAAVSQNPMILSTVLDATWRLVAVLIAAFICEYIVWHFTGRLYDRLGRESGVAEAKAQQEAAPTASSLEAEPAPSLSQATIEHDAHASEVDDPEAEVVVPAPAHPAEPETAVPTLPVSAEKRTQDRRKPLKTGWQLLRRLPYILAAMVVDALPPLAFLVAATLVLATPVISDVLMRMMIAAVVNAYVLCRLLLVVARGTFCSPRPKLRLLHVSNDAASFLTVWCRRIALVIVVGFSVVQIGDLSGMSIQLQHGLGRIFGLIMHVMLIIMVLKRRREVEAWLRGHPKPGQNFWYEIKSRAASVWHLQAIIIIVLVWIVYATEITTRGAHPLHLVIGTLALMVGFRVFSIIVLGAVDRLFALGANQTETRYTLIARRAMRYHAPLRVVLNTLIVITLIFSLLQFWGLDAMQWFLVGGLGGRLISSLGTIGVTLVVAVVIWETLNFVMQIYMDDLSQQGAYVRAARLRTVLPIMRNTLLIALFVIFVLTALSEIGVNIGPLLAGASIIGVALGFGSQKLVQDFINGIFLLLENAMQVGDWVTAGGLSGSVENLSIRTLRLRASDGSVHIIPFSSVTTVTNTNRGLGNAAVSVTISYDEDTDRVGAILTQIVLEMRGEDAFKEGMLSDFQFWGVDKIDGTTATLAGQVVCTDKARWAVQRELNRRIKITFQEQGIRIIPTSTVLSFQHPLDVRVETPEPPPGATGTGVGTATSRAGDNSAP